MTLSTIIQFMPRTHERDTDVEYLAADKARYDKALAAFRASGTLPLVEGLARGMREIVDEAVVLDTYEAPVGVDAGIVNPAVAIRGRELATGIKRGMDSQVTKGWERRTVVIIGEDDGSQTMHRWTDNWTRADKQDFGGSRGGSIPFSPQRPGNLIQRALRGENIFPTILPPDPRKVGK